MFKTNEILIKLGYINEKLFLIIFSFLAIFYITGCANEKIKYHKPVVRYVSLINEKIH